MFDDPKKELRRMEEELLATQYEEEQGPDFGSQFEIEDDWLQEAKALIGDEEEPPIRNHAGGYGARSKDPGSTLHEEEPLEESKAVLAGEPKKKGIGGLMLLALLELVGILAIVLWWVQWLL